MSFIQNHQFRALADEHVTARIALDIINAQHLKREMLKYTGVAMNLPVKSRLRVGADDHRFYAALRADFLLPLVAQMREAKHGEATNDAAFELFTDNQQRLNRFSNAHVVGHQQANRLVPQRHDKRDHLVGARAKGKFCETAERASAVAEREP